MEWQFLLPLAIQGLTPILDAAVNGEKLNATAVKGIQTTYAAACIWGQDVVDSTENELDNVALEEFKKLAEDTSREGSFPLPVLCMSE